MGDPTEGLTKAMSDAFSVVEMSVEDSATRSPFLSALTGHAKTASVNHVGNDLAHKVVHDTRFVEVHLGKPALKHAESVAATAGDAPSAGHEEAFADHFHMDPCFAGRDVAECIGGSLFAAGSPEFDLAETVVDNAISLLRRVAGERKDEPDLLWHPPHLRSERAAAPSNPLHAMGGLASGAMGGLAHAVGGGGHHRATHRDDAPECLTQTLLGASDRDAAAALTKTLFKAVGATLRDNPSPALNVARAPCKIFGDIHGQFRDLLLFFVEFGCPSHRCGDVEYCEYVFNGDWVDRGHHQLECVLLLAALKVRYPRRIHLNRGNHESAEMNAGMSARGESGFDADVRAKLGEWAGDEVFKVIQAEFFRWLPVATVIESAVLVVHGGIGDGKWTLGDLSDIPYPVEEPRDHPLVSRGVERRGRFFARFSRETRKKNPTLSPSVGLAAALERPGLARRRRGGAGRPRVGARLGRQGLRAGREPRVLPHERPQVRRPVPRVRAPGRHDPARRLPRDRLLRARLRLPRRQGHGRAERRRHHLRHPRRGRGPGRAPPQGQDHPEDGGLGVASLYGRRHVAGTR